MKKNSETYDGRVVKSGAYTNAYRAWFNASIRLMNQFKELASEKEIENLRKAWDAMEDIAREMPITVLK